MNAEGRDKQMYGQDIYRHIKTRTNGHRDKDRHTAYKHRHGQTDTETDTHSHTDRRGGRYTDTTINI